MPLDKSGSKKSIGKNIEELESTGKFGNKQAIAIALNVARKAKKSAHRMEEKGPKPPKGSGMNNKPMRRGAGRGR